MINEHLSVKLSAFRDKNQIVNVGWLGTVLVITRKAQKMDFPLDSGDLITEGGGQVAGLSGRSINKILTDFVIDEAIIHCTTAPSEALLLKCRANLQSGKRPIILTTGKGLVAAESMAENFGIEGRVEIMDALQFLTCNLYEMSLFKADQRKITIDKLVVKYNDIINAHESDASLRIEIG